MDDPRDVADLHHLEQPLDRVPFAVVDVETTGLNPALGHRVCEVACLRVQGGEVVAQFQSLVDPGRPISPGAFRVNHITPEMLRDAPSFGDVAEPLLRVMANAVIVAHNARFDLGFLRAELEIARVQPPNTVAVDTLGLARRMYGLPHNSLEALSRAPEIEDMPTHRAMSDAWITALLLERIFRDLDRRWNVRRLGELLAFQGGPSEYPLPHAVPLPPAIAEALESRSRVHMRYVDARGKETERTIRPLRVAELKGELYLIAHCYLVGELRTFRLDRVVEMCGES